MTRIAANVQRVRESIAEACERAGRSPSSVTLLAVSKTFPVKAVQEAWEAGQRDFGESRQQEGGPKVASLPEDCRWHFIGKLQRNKARKVLADFSVLHSVGSLRLAETIDRIAGETGKIPTIYLEVNLADEETKGGFSPEELRREGSVLASLASVSICGLMAIPPVTDDPEQSRRWFRKLRELRDELQADWKRPLPGLSMGMSDDYPVAIEEGSTVVRVGSAIFGKRSATA